jgi:hypothetical protein
MNLNNLHYSREQALLRLNTSDNRQILSRICQSPQRWGELLHLGWGVSEACIFDLVDYLYGMWFSRWGDRVRLDKPESCGRIEV